MKKLYLLLIGILFSYALHAQDTIFKTDQTEIKALVTEISDEVIKYKLYDFQEGPIYNLKRVEVSRIVYSNGRVEKFNAPEPAYSGYPSSDSRDSSAKDRPESLAGQKTSIIGASTVSAGRTFIGVTYSQQHTFSTDSYDFETNSVYGFNVLLEKYFEPKQGDTKMPSKGFGLASTNYFGYSEKIDNVVYTGSRHYGTAYLFKELPIKNILTLGGLAGGGMCYTRGKADDSSDEAAGVFGGGAHLGLFAQKALTSSTSKKPATLVRLGYDIFIMSNANVTLGTNLSISF